MQTFSILNLKVMAAKASAERICFLLFPLKMPEGWLDSLAQKYNVSLAVISGMDWDDDMTPWPAKGEPPGCPDFKGKAPEFLRSLAGHVVPKIEKRMGMEGKAERTLAGVSLSGLFTLWQWMTCDTFHNIISLSGSFWYDGFADRLTSQPVPEGKGKAFFLLGNQEAKARVKAFQSVQTDTEKIVAYLEQNGVETAFELVPGNHYQYGEQRLVRALAWMFG